MLTIAGGSVQTNLSVKYSRGMFIALFTIAKTWKQPKCLLTDEGIKKIVVGGSREREHKYTYGWFMLMYCRNQHNIVKQLSFN